MAARTTEPTAAVDVSTTPTLRERLIVGAVSASPMLTFTVALSATKSLAVAVCAAVAAAIAVCCWRIATKRPMRTTVAVVVVVALQVMLATFSGNAMNFFLPRLAWMAVWSPVQLVLILLGRPPLGWAVGQLRGEPWAWRRCRVQRRAYSVASLLPWSLATLEMVVALWLYAHGHVALLGGTEMLTNAIHLGAFIVAWRIAVRLIGAHRCPDPLGNDSLGERNRSCVSA